jgi:hypothetical protein
VAGRLEPSVACLSALFGGLEPSADGEALRCGDAPICGGGCSQGEGAQHLQGARAPIRNGRSMTVDRRELYQSSNGDRWFLARSADTGVFVEHVPNPPSGGRTSRIEIGAFLMRGPQGPEHQELLRLIGTLVEGSAGARE